MERGKIKRTLSSFVKDDSGFVSRDSLLKCGGISLALSAMLFGIGRDFEAEAYSVHTDLQSAATHVNCLTNSGGCGTLTHTNENRHINHTSNCY